MLQGSTTFRQTVEGTCSSRCRPIAKRALWASMRSSSNICAQFPELSSWPRLVSNVMRSSECALSGICFASSIMLFAEQKPVIITFFRLSWLCSERRPGCTELLSEHPRIESCLMAGSSIWKWLINQII